MTRTDRQRPPTFRPQMQRGPADAGPRGRARSAFDSVVERAVDLGGLRCLAGFVRRGRLGARLAAEVQVERAEVDRGAAVLADLLERLQQRVPLVRLAHDRLARRGL